VQARDGWIHHLMAQELADPTPALDLVVKHVIKPRTALLGEILARLIGCPTNDKRVERCVMSVQSQCLVLLNDKIAKRFQPVAITPKHLDALAEHITEFSLAGVRAVK
jgi:hypothetical protein